MLTGVPAGFPRTKFSPGDDAIAVPYVYVGLRQLPPPADAFWNDLFGANRTWDDVPDLPAAPDFLHAGHAAMTSGSPPGPT